MARLSKRAAKKQKRRRKETEAGGGCAGPALLEPLGGLSWREPGLNLYARPPSGRLLGLQLEMMLLFFVLFFAAFNHTIIYPARLAGTDAIPLETCVAALPLCSAL